MIRFFEIFGFAHIDLDRSIIINALNVVKRP